MEAEATVYGVIITSGLAYFAWVVTSSAEEEPPTQKAKSVDNSSSSL
jgi:hypothetical protein